MVKFSIIVAVTWPNLGIGFEGGLPWKSLQPDMSYFQNVTTTTKSDGMRNAVIMGRKTWESFPTKFRPLVNRINVILTRNPEFRVEHKDVEIFQSFDDAISKLPSMYQNLGGIFVIGGSELYREALQHEGLRNLYITKVYEPFECDCFLGIDKTSYISRTISCGE